jgi:hypothetical protein
VIALGQRGAADEVLRKRLAAEPLVFLTHDEEFREIPRDFRSQVIFSALPQRLPIRERVDIWSAALDKFEQRRPPQRLFEILPSGELVAWEIDRVGRHLLGPI